VDRALCGFKSLLGFNLSKEFEDFLLPPPFPLSIKVFGNRRTLILWVTCVIRPYTGVFSKTDSCHALVSMTHFPSTILSFRAFLASDLCFFYDQPGLPGISSLLSPRFFLRPFSSSLARLFVQRTSSFSLKIRVHHPAGGAIFSTFYPSSEISLFFFTCKSIFPLD